MLRDAVVSEHRAVGQIRHPVDAGQWRDEGAPADIDEDARRGQPLLGDRDGIAAEKAGMALQYRAARHIAQPALDAGAGIGRDRVGPHLDPGHVDAGRRVEHDAVLGAAPREVRGIGTGDERLGGHAAGVDAGAAEQMALDQGHRHPGGGKPAGERRAGLPGADDDRIERPAHLITTTTRIATMIATASSINAAGISLRNTAASLALAAYPPRVPITAPTIPATPPAISQPEDAPSAAPDRAPDRMRAPNPPGALRLGAEGSWSMTSSTNASTVNIPTAQTEPMKASGVPASGSQPR